MKEKLMKAVNSEVKKVVSRAKVTQAKLKTALQGQSWIEDARKYAEKQSKEVKKLLSSDIGKVKIFLEKERKELGRLQKEIPVEVKKLRGFVNIQRKEFEKLLKNLRRATQTGNFKSLVKNKRAASAAGTQGGTKKRKKAASPSVSTGA